MADKTTTSEPRRMRQILSPEPVRSRKPVEGERQTSPIRAIEEPGLASPEDILALQRLAGNQAVTHLIQAKLVVGAADDPFEREADRIADQVLSMPSTPAHQTVGTTGVTPGAQRQSEEEEVQTKPLANSITPLSGSLQRSAEDEEEIQTTRLQRSAEEEEEVQTVRVQRAPEEEEEIQTTRIQRSAEEEEEVQTARVQRAPEEEEEIQTARLQRSAEEEEEVQTARIQRAPEEEEEIQTARLQRSDEEEEEVQTARVQRAPEEDELPLQGMRLQRQEEEEELQTQRLQRLEEEEEVQTARNFDPMGSFTAGVEVENTLHAQQGSGSPLPVEVRQFMEPRFGADFSGVRLHTSSEAAVLNRSLHAQAFTHGQDIYLGEGRYDPGSPSGKHLLAHELTHVVQQTGGRLARRPQVTAIPGSIHRSMIQRVGGAWGKPLTIKPETPEEAAERKRLAEIEQQKRLLQERAALFESTVTGILTYVEDIVNTQKDAVVDGSHTRVNYFPKKTFKTTHLDTAIDRWKAMGGGYHGFKVAVKDGIRQAHFLKPQPGREKFRANVHVKPSD